jgi:hypothetical protein
LTRPQRASHLAGQAGDSGQPSHRSEFFPTDVRIGNMRIVAPTSNSKLKRPHPENHNSVELFCLADSTKVFYWPFMSGANVSLEKDVRVQGAAPWKRRNK